MTKAQHFKNNYLIPCILLNIVGFIPILLHQEWYISVIFFTLADVVLPIGNHISYSKKTFNDEHEW